MGAGMAALAAVSTPSTRRGAFSGGRVLFATAAGVAVGAYIALEFFPGQPFLQARRPDKLAVSVLLRKLTLEVAAPSSCLDVFICATGLAINYPRAAVSRAIRCALPGWPRSWEQLAAGLCTRPPVVHAPSILLDAMRMHRKVTRPGRAGSPAVRKR